MLLEKFDNTFQEMMKTNQPIVKIQPFSDQPNTNVEIISCISEVYKNYFRCMVNFLLFVHENKFCTKGFSLENIVLQSDTIKFFGVGFFRPKKKKFDERVKDDFKNLAEVVKEICGGYKIPEDLKHWIDILENRSILLRGMLCKHVVIIGFSERIWFVRDVMERHETVIQHHALAIKNIFQVKYKKRKTWYNRINSRHGPMLSCFKRCGTRNGYMNVANPEHQMLRFCRNFAVHANPSTPNVFITDPMIDALIFYRFGEEICNFQEAAYLQLIGGDSRLLDKYRYLNEV